MAYAHEDLIELCRLHLDPVSAEAVKRYLGGRFDERLQASDMPPIDAVARRARRRGGRDGAIDLAIVALGLVGHMSWWRIGDEYGLSASSTKGALGGAARRRFLDALGRRDVTPKPPDKEATRLAPANVEKRTLEDLGRLIGG